MKKDECKHNWVEIEITESRVGARDEKGCWYVMGDGPFEHAFGLDCDDKISFFCYCCQRRLTGKEIAALGLPGPDIILELVKKQLRTSVCFRKRTSNAANGAGAENDGKQ